VKTVNDLLVWVEDNFAAQAGHRGHFAVPAHIYDDGIPMPMPAQGEYQLIRYSYEGSGFPEVPPDSSHAEHVLVNALASDLFLMLSLALTTRAGGASSLDGGETWAWHHCQPKLYWRYEERVEFTQNSENPYQFHIRTRLYVPGAVSTVGCLRKLL
jgi:hypothetical protein